MNTRDLTKKTMHLLSRNILSTGAVLALMGVAAFAAAPTGGYAPGATLDPDCSPGDTDCSVVFSQEANKFVDGTTATNAVFTGGNVGIGTTGPQGPLHIGTNIDAGLNSPTNSASFIIGDYDGAHIEMDSNEIMSMSGSTELLPLYLGGRKIGFTTDYLYIQSTSLNDAGYITQAGLGGIGLATDLATINKPSLYVADTYNVGIGTTEPEQKLHVVNDGTYARAYIDTYGDSNKWSLLDLRSSGGTQSSPTAKLAGNRIGEIRFHGYNGVDYGSSNMAAGIYAIAESDFADGDTPTSLRFNTTDSGSEASTTKMVIQGNGNVGIGTSGPSSTFSVGNRIIFDKGKGNAANGSDILFTAQGTIAAESHLRLYSGTTGGSGKIIFGRGSEESDLATDIMWIDDNGDLTVSGLSGTGNAYACLTSAGKLYRSATACN